MSIVLYMHAAPIGNWQDVTKELLKTMQKNGLRDAIAEMHYCIAESWWPDAVPIEAHDWHTIEGGKFEFPTLKRLYAHAIRNPGNIYVYVHTKGVSHPENEALADWRRYMAHYLIGPHWKECFGAVDSACDTAGVDFGFYKVTEMACETHGDSDNTGVAQSYGIHPHYSGNFWWAKGAYLASLPPVDDTKDRHAAEFWLGSGKGTHACLWHSGIPVMRHHEIRYPPEAYGHA